MPFVMNTKKNAVLFADCLLYFSTLPEWSYFRSPSFFSVARKHRGSFICAISSICTLKKATVLEKMGIFAKAGNPHLLECSYAEETFLDQIDYLIKQFHGHQSTKKNTLVPEED